MKPNRLFIVVLFIGSFSASCWANAPSKLAHQCQKLLIYDIYLSGLKIGQLKRLLNWQDNQARVETTSKVNILGLGSTYHQLTDLYWSTQENKFLTRAFSQKVVGLSSRDVVVTFSSDGHLASVNLNGEVKKYHNKEQALLDLDALGMQLRLNVINGLQGFQLLRQAPEQVISYKFELADKEEIDLPRWGVVKVIRINGVDKHKGTSLWFAPQLDYQLVKAEFNLFINPTVYLSAYKIDCITQ